MRVSQAQSWLILLLVVALPCLTYPLAWFPEHAVRHRFELQLPIAVLYLIGALVVLALQLRSADTVGMPAFGVDRALLAVLGVGGVSTLLSSNVYFSIGAWVLLLANATLLYGVGFWFDLKYAKLLAALWLATAVTEAGYGLWQNAHGGYPWGTIGNVDWMAAYLGISMLAGLSLWGPSEGRRMRAIWLVPAYAIMLLAFIRCDSMGAWLGLGTAVAACALRVLWSRGRMYALLFAGVVTVAAATVATLKFSYIEGLWHVNVRPPIWKGALHMLRDSPLIGHGIGTFTYQYASYRPPEYFNTNVVANVNLPENFKHRRQPADLTDHAHNEFLEIAAESGVLGLGIMCWLFVSVLVRGWRSWRPDNPHRWLALGAWGAVIALLVHNQFDINLRRPPSQTLFWLLMGLVVRCSPRREATTEPQNGASIASKPIFSAVATPSSQPTLAATSPLGRWIPILCFLSLALLLGKRYFYDTVAANAAYRNALIERGDGPISPERAGRAMKSYLLCLDRDPYRVEAWYRLAYLCAQFRETDEQAIDYYKEVTKLAPDYADVNSNLAYLFVQRDRKKEAIPYLRRAIELNPYNLDLRVVLCRIYVDLKLDRDLKEEILGILQVAPDHPWANDVWWERFKQEKMELTPTKTPRSRPRR